MTFDSMRFVVGADAEGDEQSVTWFSALHAGPLVMITSEFTLNTMIARELHLSGIESYLGTVESNLLCVPDAIRRGTASPEGLVTPSHHAVQELYRKVVGPNADYITSSAGNEMVSIDRLQCNPTYGFDYGDTLVDVRASLDLSYLDRVFET
ncbi:hypothetical protein HQO24_24455 [Rhodococcus fascians]|nr:hypothetical protein [Rhodococcus fascians]MBY4399638.1 hypothetical protein [Rhodococcus fascians]MBY4409444.1 hypothetical protein [Rhodococcus fascians]MBY4424229.1 hypothetical protein [Rhodococcus fascians]MBY4462941.1 hypothetical protein [Rhodococcus fascians]